MEKSENFNILPDEMLQIIEISKRFGEKTVLFDISFTIKRAEIVALLGPSGCGKTTLLRIIAGLENADSGEILLDNKDLTDIPVHKRNFGMVFQDYALFPHMSVADNVAFGLKMAGWDSDRQAKRVAQVLELVNLSGFEERMVFELSGGEQQRVAVARSIAPLPRLLLLDEPLGALDRTLRERLMGDLRQILKRATSGKSSAPAVPASFFDDENNQIGSEPTGITSIYVTHDQEEAFAIADRVFIMNKGRIEQEGLPVEIYHRPKTSFVARFLGMENLLKATIIQSDPPIVQCKLGQFIVSDVPKGFSGEGFLLIRPETGQIVSEQEKGRNMIEGRLIQVSFRGFKQLVTILVEAYGGDILLNFSFDSGQISLIEGSRIKMRFNAKDLLFLKR